MKLGIGCAGIGPCVTPEFVTAAAKTAEAVGFSSFWASEHPALFEHYDSRPRSGAGEFTFQDPTLAYLDPLIMLTWAAAVTTRIGLGTSVALASLRQPIIYAKEIASLDLLSRGRMTLGVGSGWAREQYAAIGIPFDRRGARLVEVVEAVRVLWRQKSSSYHGEFVEFDGAHSYPKPSRGDVPVYFGGVSDIMLKRVARYGDGWIPVELTPEQVGRGMDKIRALADASGRDASRLKTIVVMHPDTIQSGLTVKPDDVRRYRDIGVDELVLAAHLTLPLERAALEDALVGLARRYIEPLRQC